MERLTRRIAGVVVYAGTKNPYSTGQIPCEVDSAGIREMMYRLAAYEDTGLTPESVEALKLTEMFNICEACVYAPCFCGNEPENCIAYLQKNGEGKDADY